MNPHKRPPDETEPVGNRFKAFARSCVAVCPNLHGMADFPGPLWKQMGRCRLFGVAIDKKYQGQGQTIRTLAGAGRMLAAHGGNMGVALSWLIHEMTARWLIQGFGTDAQKDMLLPLLAGGEKTACLAVSEPKAGAHPKYLRTRAEKTAQGFVLNGEKTYLTNGPVADYFITIAVTGVQEGKNTFTGFIVPKDSPGLTLTDPLSFPFLRPCPHGGIRLTDCRVTPEQVLGHIGDAYHEMALPFRTAEDALITALISGGLEFIFSRLIRQIKTVGDPCKDSVIEEIAALKCALDSLTHLSGAAAAELDAGSTGSSLFSLGLFFRTQTRAFLEATGKLAQKTRIPHAPALASMITDIEAILRIAENPAKTRLQKLGKTLLNGK